MKVNSEVAFLSQQLIKRVLLYVVGLFMLSFGVSLSIYANFGVSPVSSLAYGLSLITGVSVGATTIFTHIIYIIIQMIILKRFDMKYALTQLVIAFLFGFFVNATITISTLLLPVAGTIVLQCVYLALSLLLVACGLFIYTNAQYTLMPYDELTQVISTSYKMPFGKAKIIGDVSNVIIAIILCLTFLKTMGSIGIGTIVAAVSIGKILGIVAKKFQPQMDLFLKREELI